jgi:hypothetical protein
VDKFLGTGYADLLEVDQPTGDPLNLAALSERLYNTVFPGYNNVVRHIRVYSALCWMSLQVQDSFAADPPRTNKEAKERQKIAFEKMELALLWANEGLLKGLRVAGASRQFPQNNTPQKLAFTEWTRQATLRGPTTYGPSLTNGLKFLDSNWVCTPTFGRELGNSFGKLLGPSRAHAWLKDVRNQFATRNQINSSSAALQLFKPSADEQGAFLASYFPKRLADCESALDRNRWHSVHLVLHAIQVHKDSRPSEAQLRASMARGITEAGQSVLRPGLEPMHAAWSILQLRQLQRLATETLFSVVLDWVRRNNAAGKVIRDCLDDLVSAAKPFYDEQGIRTASELAQFLKNLQGDYPSLYVAAAGKRQPSADLFEYLQRVGSRQSRTWGTNGCAAVAEAVNALTFCGLEVTNLSMQKHTGQLLARLSAERCSLIGLSQALRAQERRSVTDWIRTLASDWAVGRYFEVAIQRATETNGKLRFAFSSADAGLHLTGVQTGSFQPSYSADKLYHTLLLCEQCDLVQSSVKDEVELFSLTADGRRRVKSYGQDASQV